MSVPSRAEASSLSVNRSTLCTIQEAITGGMPFFFQTLVIDSSIPLSLRRSLLPTDIKSGSIDVLPGAIHYNGRADFTFGGRLVIGGSNIELEARHGLFFPDYLKLDRALFADATAFLARTPPVEGGRAPVLRADQLLAKYFENFKDRAPSFDPHAYADFVYKTYIKERKESLQGPVRSDLLMYEDKLLLKYIKEREGAATSI